MYLTREKFISAVNKSNSDYWKEGIDYRWKYMSIVIEEMKKINPQVILEAGASGIPLNDISFLYDYPQHNLDVTPYELSFVIPDKSIDCFVALQTWEHLDRQEVAFAEVMRISKTAILSFPLNWKHGDKRHKGITREKIASWTLNVKPEKEIEVNNRLICVWRF